MNAPLWPRLRPLLVMALVLAVAAACFTVRETTREGGISREARLNPWLAIGQLLEARGLNVAASPAYTRLPARTDTIVLASPLEQLALPEREALWDWVADGGHLVLRATGSADEQKWLEDLDLRSERLAQEPVTPWNLPQTGTQALDIPDEGRLQGRLHGPLVLESDEGAAWGVRDARGWRVLRQGWGDGQLTLSTGFDFLHNREIGDADHAALAWRLLDAAPGQRVLLVHGEDRPALLALLLEVAAPFFAALALFIAVWLWQAGQRFGPLAPAMAAPRRRLSEHLEAAGRHLHRLGRLDLLLEASRQRLLADVQRRHPQWRRLPAPALAAELGRRAGLEPGAIVRVLTATPDHLPQLAADLRLIQRLRKAL